MKILLQSDLHHEAYRRRGIEPDPLPCADADLIVLAGDIDEGVEGVRWAVRQAEATACPVVYVPGNHEYYRNRYPDTLERMRAEAAGSQVTVLDRDALVLGDVRVLGATLWTDFRVTGRAREAMAAAAEFTLDYRRIPVADAGGGERLIVPEDTLAWHRAAVDWLQAELGRPFAGRTVVVSHMAPSPRSAHPEFGLNATAPAFISDLERLMDPDRVALWLHGHTHASLDYRLSGVRVVSNQRGYPTEAVPGGFRPDCVVTV